MQPQLTEQFESNAQDHYHRRHRRQITVGSTRATLISQALDGRVPELHYLGAHLEDVMSASSTGDRHPYTDEYYRLKSMNCRAMSCSVECLLANPDSHSFWTWLHRQVVHLKGAPGVKLQYTAKAHSEFKRRSSLVPKQGATILYFIKMLVTRPDTPRGPERIDVWAWRGARRAL